jgi:hypothetical protein
MPIVAPQGRQHRSADALLRLVRTGCATLPAPRSGDAEIALPDALMSAGALLSLPSPSLLAFDKARAEGTVSTISGLERAPCAPRRRERRDPAGPASRRPRCPSVLGPLQRGQALEPMAVLEDYAGVALEGTGYFASKTMPCASCLPKVHRNGSLTSAHQRVGAAMLHPDGRAVIPLMPAPMVPPDGTAQPAGARHAAKRLIAQLRQDHPPLKVIVTAARLRAKAPPLETLQDHPLPAMLGGTEGGHAALCAQGQAAEHAGRVTQDERHARAAEGVPRVRFVNAMPLKASNADVQVHCLA